MAKERFTNIYIHLVSREVVRTVLSAYSIGGGKTAHVGDTRASCAKV